MSEVQTDIIILTPKDIMRIYELPSPTVYEILKMRGCPNIKGGLDSRGHSLRKHYRIEKSAFEDFLRRKST